MIAAEGEQVDLDADLEQQEDDTDIGQDVELVAVDDISWRERRDREADEKVAEHGRQPDPPSQPVAARRTIAISRIDGAVATRAE